MKTLRWEIDRLLARSSRPGYCCKDVSPEVVDEWIANARHIGIKSIICLLTEDQLAYYRRITGGLLTYYCRQGFNIVHIPVIDPAHDPRGWDDLERRLADVYAAFDRLPKPVLVRCSADVDRTGRAVDYIRQQLMHDRG